MAELILDGSSREEKLAEGILGILSPAVEQVDEQISEVRYVLPKLLIMPWYIREVLLSFC